MTAPKGCLPWPTSGLPRGFGRWLKECDEVSVWAPVIGYVRLTKVTAAALARRKGRHLSARYVPELGLLLLEPVPS